MTIKADAVGGLKTNFRRLSMSWCWQLYSSQEDYSNSSYLRPMADKKPRLLETCWCCGVLLEWLRCNSFWIWGVHGCHKLSFWTFQGWIFPHGFFPSPVEVRPLAGQKGLSCGVDTNAGAKDRKRLPMRLPLLCGSQLLVTWAVGAEWWSGSSTRPTWAWFPYRDFRWSQRWRSFKLPAKEEWIFLLFYVVFGSGMLLFCGCKFGNPRIKAGDIYSNPFS